MAGELASLAGLAGFQFDKHLILSFLDGTSREVAPSCFKLLIAEFLKCQGLLVPPRGEFFKVTFHLICIDQICTLFSDFDLQGGHLTTDPVGFGGAAASGAIGVLLRQPYGARLGFSCGLFDLIERHAAKIPFGNKQSGVIYRITSQMLN